MEREEILQKAKKKNPVGEMESNKINKINWIALIVSGVVAVVMLIVEGVQQHITAIFAIAFVCFTWASVFYFCQYFVAKRRWPVLIGAVLECIGAIAMLTLYVLFSVGVLNG